jgi:hypothetical protein
MTPIQKKELVNILAMRITDRVSLSTIKSFYEEAQEQRLNDFSDQDLIQLALCYDLDKEIESYNQE